MTNEYDLKQFGIESPVNIIGELTIIRCEAGLPTVFLFDENHDNLNECIDKNINNARELIQNANVRLVGVENFSSVANLKARFANELIEKNYSDYIKDVENIDLNHQLFCEINDMLDENDSPNLRKLIQNHPLNIKRSKHFIRALLEYYTSNNTNSNLILNCGGDHNTHIEGWVKSNEIDSIAGIKANYIRVNAID